MPSPKYRSKWQRRKPMPPTLAKWWEQYEMRRFMAALYPDIDWAKGKRD